MAEAAGGSSSVALKGLTIDWVDSFLDSQVWTKVQAPLLICFACVAQRNAAVAGRDQAR
jgi:hypothetical protein